MTAIVNVFDYEAQAERLLPRHVWDYIAGGAADESTVARNRRAFSELALRPRFMRAVCDRDVSTTVLGVPIPHPVAVAPVAFQPLVHPEAEAETAAGAGRSGALTIVPATTPERVAAAAQAATGPCWLQFYHRGREWTAEFVELAERLGLLALCATVDAPTQSTKERDRRNSFLPPYDTVRYSGPPEGIPEASPPGTPFTWEDLEWLRSRTTLPIVLKGIMTWEDSQAAVGLGASGIFVSNHGGRLLDGTLSAIEALPEIVAAVDGRAEVYLDSGVRRGTDVLKALALGARAVAIGRPFLWGLAVEGAAGVDRVLQILRMELEVALGLCGQRSIRELDPGLLHVPAGWRARGMEPDLLTSI